MLRLLRRVEASVTWTWLCLEPDVTTRCENLYGASGLLPLCYTCPMARELKAPIMLSLVGSAISNSGNFACRSHPYPLHLPDGEAELASDLRIARPVSQALEQLLPLLRRHCEGSALLQRLRVTC